MLTLVISQDKCILFVYIWFNLDHDDHTSSAAVEEALVEVDFGSTLVTVRCFTPLPLLLLDRLLPPPSRRFFFFLMYLFCLVANSVNVIVTSLTVTECCVNLFLSIINPVLPLEVGGEYLIILPLTSNGVILNRFSATLVEGKGDDVVGLGDMSEYDDEDVDEDEACVEMDEAEADLLKRDP